jgi:hypothetical protein
MVRERDQRGENHQGGAIPRRLDLAEQQRAQQTAPWPPSTSRRSSAPTRTTRSTTTTPRTTAWADRRRPSAPTSGSLSRSARRRHPHRQRARAHPHHGWLVRHDHPRNDGSPNRGQWDLADAYKYISEGWGGYHWDVNHGLNVDAGIFVSYIGLFSYYNFDNWTYQPSFVSSNTPWFFNGLRIQYSPRRS